MSKPAPRTLEMIRSHYLTPHMLRVTLGGATIDAHLYHQRTARRAGTSSAQKPSLYIELLEN